MQKKKKEEIPTPLTHRDVLPANPFHGEREFEEMVGDIFDKHPADTDYTADVNRCIEYARNEPDITKKRRAVWCALEVSPDIQTRERCALTLCISAAQWAGLHEDKVPDDLVYEALHIASIPKTKIESFVIKRTIANIKKLDYTKALSFANAWLERDPSNEKMLSIRAESLIFESSDEDEMEAAARKLSIENPYRYEIFQMILNRKAGLFDVDTLVDDPEYIDDYTVQVYAAEVLLNRDESAYALKRLARLPQDDNYVQWLTARAYYMLKPVSEENQAKCRQIVSQLIGTYPNVDTYKITLLQVTPPTRSISDEHPLLTHAKLAWGVDEFERIRMCAQAHTLWHHHDSPEMIRFSQEVSNDFWDGEHRRPVNNQAIRGINQKRNGKSHDS